MLQSLTLADRRHALPFAGAQPRRALHNIGGDFMEIASRGGRSGLLAAASGFLRDGMIFAPDFSEVN